MIVTESKALQASYYSIFNLSNKSYLSLGTDFLKDIQDACVIDNIKTLVQTDTEIYYRYLSWDSDHFGIPTYRIEFIYSRLEKIEAIDAYRSILSQLINQLRILHRSFYIFAELPSEAIYPIQAFCLSEWRLIETRLTYCNDHVQDYSFKRRFPVREATIDDISNLRATAIRARNNFDRFHADFFFSEETADNFLATFIENSIRGFADITLVPNSDSNQPDAFLTANFLPKNNGLITDRNAARMVLSAVGETRRGWYMKLISEMSYVFKEKGVDIAFMTTQATNKTVIRTWEKLGYSFGRSSHIFVHTHAA
jgi:dTDP-4-amino-4,6-dideoxy-D-galactose acyltransferase